MLIHNPKELAIMVKSIRKKQKLSQKALADLVGLKQATVSAFENKPDATKIDTLFRILSAAKLDMLVEAKESGNHKLPWGEEW